MLSVTIVLTERACYGGHSRRFVPH